MQFRHTYYIIFLSFIFSQSFYPGYFNGISLGGNIEYSDSRSMGIGNTFVTTGTTSSVISRNPSKLSYLAENIQIDFQINMLMNFERRSIDILDGWGEFLAETDYVFNQHQYNYNAIGILFGHQFKNFNLGFGLSYKPLSSFDYTYEEEIRGDEDFDDGVLGIRDPIIGYHLYSSRGNLDILSGGLGISKQLSDFSNPLAIGISFNKIISSNISSSIDVDTLYNSINPYNYDNMSNVLPTHYSHKAKGEFFITASLEIPLSQELLLICSYESDAASDSDDISNFEISESTGLPWLLEFTEDEQLTLIDLGINYLKPERTTLGLIHSSSYDNSMILAFEIIQETYNNYINNSIEEYKLGFEYSTDLGMPIRAGITYKEALFSPLDPVTTMTLGSGKKFNNLNIDFALNYNNTKYRYLDIFPLSTFDDINCNQDCDKIIENNLTFSTTFKWSF